MDFQTRCHRLIRGLDGDILVFLSYQWYIIKQVYSAIIKVGKAYYMTQEEIDLIVGSITANKEIPGTGSVRSSSDDDPCSYKDASTLTWESGEAAPAGRGGVIVPRATALGASRGHDHTKPMPITIDPGRPWSVTLDIGAIPKQVIDDTYKSVMRAGHSDPQVIAQLVYAALAKIAPQFQKTGQITEQPRMSIAAAQSKYFKPVTMDEQMPGKQMISTKVFDKPTGAPTQSATFEFTGVGHLTSSYHYIIRSDIALVLVYDTRYLAGQSFFPETDPDKSFIIDPHQHKSIYKVMAPGIRFTLDNLEFCILFIDEEAQKD